MKAGSMATVPEPDPVLTGEQWAALVARQQPGDITLGIMLSPATIHVLGCGGLSDVIAIITDLERAAREQWYTGKRGYDVGTTCPCGLVQR